MPLRVKIIKRRNCHSVRNMFRSPMQVDKIILHKSGDSYPICPRCDCSLDREYMRFCDRCGQRLSWGKEKPIQTLYAPRDKYRRKKRQNCQVPIPFLRVNDHRE